jgi:predicted patatin/cPLA2 family phospholipase
MTSSRQTIVGLFLLAWVLAGCGQAVKRTPVPLELADQAVVEGGIAGARFWGDRIDPKLQADLMRTAKEHPMPVDPLAEDGPGVGALVLSGGGDAGAYGAGLLCGWTDHGTRPRFRIVTGVSTGALIAPLAFLGPKYDSVLREAYTTVETKDVMKMRPVLDWLRFDSVADSKPLLGLTARQITDEMIREIAIEHEKGRRLFVQTVNLDAQRPVIWDMGAIAIASRDRPEAAALFRQVMVASASIPGVFPPQYIRVEADGARFDEMHVDGGTASQMLMSTLPVNLQELRGGLSAVLHRPSVYIIRNGYVRPEWKTMQPKLVPIAGRAISSMIKSQAATELQLMYLEAKLADIDFYLSYIPDAYERTTEKGFDTQEMNRLFREGYDQAMRGESWRRLPPRIDPARDIGVRLLSE